MLDGAARPRRRRARRGRRGLRGGRRPGRPRLDRRPRAGHPARREGAHRGVQRARRPRAHPQGHDLARPDRERRAAAGPRLAASWSATGWSPRWPGWPGWPPSTTALVMAGRSHNVAAQATTLGKRFATAADELLVALRAARGPARALPAARHQGPGRHRARTCSTCSTATRRKLAELERRVAAHLGFDRVLTSVGQVYPRSLDFDVVSALVQVAAGAVQPGHHDPADGRPRAGHRGLQGRARSAPRRCRTR